MLMDLLIQKRKTLVERWFVSILDTYPEDTTKFLRTDPDRFTNPVRHRIREGVEGIIGELLKGGSPEALLPFLDNIVRIRAVQEFSPSAALGVVFSLKTVVREVLGKQAEEARMREALRGFDARVDDLALQAFDVYTACREKVYELRIMEVKRQKAVALKLLERSDRSGGDVDEDGTPQS